MLDQIQTRIHCPHRDPFSPLPYHLHNTRPRPIQLVIMVAGKLTGSALRAGIISVCGSAFLVSPAMLVVVAAECRRVMAFAS